VNEANHETPILAHFRLFIAEVVTRFLKLWQKNQAEFTSNVKVAIFKELSPRMLDCEWWMFNGSGKHVSGFRSGV
jgi:hypothetical protein